MKTINELCDIVRQTAYSIHIYHGHGHLEKVYENALAHRLRKLGLIVEQQHPLKVYDEDGTLIGEYYADLLVDGRLIVELKAVREIADEHVAQVLGYLKSARIEHGLLINFGSRKFHVKKYILNDQGPQSALRDMVHWLIATKEHKDHKRRFECECLVAMRAPLKASPVFATAMTPSPAAGRPRLRQAHDGRNSA
jgi:GxxExxY protein